MSTISGSRHIIEGSKRPNILFSRGTKFEINEALYSPMSHRNLLIFKDICSNAYHIETISEGNDEFLQITSITQGTKLILEKLPTFSTGLYYTKIYTIETHVIVNQKFTNNFVVWHDQLGHTSSIMMRRII